MFRGALLEVRGQRVGARDSRPEIRGQRFGARDSGPEIRGQRFGARDSGPEVHVLPPRNATGPAGHKSSRPQIQPATNPAGHKSSRPQVQPATGPAGHRSSRPQVQPATCRPPSGFRQSCPGTDDAAHRTRDEGGNCGQMLPQAFAITERPVVQTGGMGSQDHSSASNLIRSVEVTIPTNLSPSQTGNEWKLPSAKMRAASRTVPLTGIDTGLADISPLTVYV